MVHFQISISDIINILLLSAAVIGIFLTFAQVRGNYRTQKATFFKDLYLILFNDPDINRTLYQIEKGVKRGEDFVFKKETFLGSDFEKSLDHLLALVELVCDLYYQNLLTKHEMSYFDYEFYVLYKSKGVQDYYSYLERSSNKNNVNPFPGFMRYCVSRFGSDDI